MDARLDLLETVFKALADRTRLRILALLAGGEVCVCHIHESLRIPQPKASRHLAYLKRAGLIDGRKDGLWVHYRLASPADELVRRVTGAVGCCLDQLPSTIRDRKRLEKEMGIFPLDVADPRDGTFLATRLGLVRDKSEDASQKE